LKPGFDFICKVKFYFQLKIKQIQTLTKSCFLLEFGNKSQKLKMLIIALSILPANIFNPLFDFIEKKAVWNPLGLLLFSKKSF
jgi:hypothetical protein